MKFSGYSENSLLKASFSQGRGEIMLLALSNEKRKRVVFWLFLAPVLFAFFMVIIIPFILGIYYSFTDWSSSARTAEGLKFLGFQNYAKSFSDPGFLYSFIITSAFTLFNVIAVNVTGILLALLVTSQLKFRNFYRAGFFVPNLIGGLVLGYVWQFIFNNALPSFGTSLSGLAFLADPENLVLSKVSTSMMALVIVDTWRSGGYIMMIYIAAIESIPTELNEASKIDGATGIQRFFFITIPMIAQAFTITTFLTLVNSFKAFDVNVSLTSGGPSTMFLGKPIFGTELLAMNIYNTAFIGNNLAMGQARAVIFFVVLVMISVFQVYTNKKKEVEM